MAHRCDLPFCGQSMVDVVGAFASIAPERGLVILVSYGLVNVYGQLWPNKTWIVVLVIAEHGIMEILVPLCDIGANSGSGTILVWVCSRGACHSVRFRALMLVLWKTWLFVCIVNVPQMMALVMYT